MYPVLYEGAIVELMLDNHLIIIIRVYCVLRYC